MENQEKFKSLYQKYLSGTASKEEVALLLSFIQSEKEDETIEGWIDEGMSNLFLEKPIESLDAENRIGHTRLNLLQMLKSENNQSILKTKMMWPLWAGIAASIITISGLFFYFNAKPKVLDTEESLAFATKIMPVGNKATLTLDNGKIISLSEVGKGVISEQLGTTIQKTDEGIISYSASGQNNSKTNLEFNTIHTPNGGEYKVQLPDGTWVQLNAGSTLKYPVSFKGKDRRIILTGEAYFEVAHDKERPFIVETRGQLVQVLGTHFNVNSYLDEPNTITTLEEGSVKVIANNLEKTIIPGQQTLLSSSRKLMVRQADLETTLAWKNGFIAFKSADIKSILRLAQRWYNIKVEYQGDVSNKTFTGDIPRSSSLADLLHLLSLSKINFNMEEQSNGAKKLIIKS